MLSLNCHCPGHRTDMVGAVKRPKLEPRDVIDLIEDAPVKNELYSVGNCSNGVIRLIQSRNAPNDPMKVTFDDIIQAEVLTSCFLSAYVADIAWLHSRLGSVNRVVLSLDKSGKDSRLPKNWQLVIPDFPKFPSYGVMHSKIMLLFYPNFCRLVISSANLMDYDYDVVQNVS